MVPTMTDFLPGYEPLSVFVTKRLKKHERTAYRLTAKGMPYVQVANERWVHPEIAGAWFIANMKQRQRGRARRARK